MRVLCLGAALAAFSMPPAASAESRWLISSRLEVSEVRDLCAKVDDVRLLARMQMIATGDARWRRLSRQELVVEGAIMGALPLDASRCYLVVRAGLTDESERRVFEVREFAVGTARTSVLTIGRSHEAPPW